MITIAIFIAYAIGWYKSSLYLARVYNENHEKEWSFGLKEHNKKEHLMGAMFASVIWPIWLLLHLLTRHMLGKVPPTTKELQRQVEERGQRIKELERKLNIK